MSPSLVSTNVPKPYSGGMTENASVGYSVREGVGRITLRATETRNALTEELVSGLLGSLRAVPEHGIRDGLGREPLFLEVRNQLRNSNGISSVVVVVSRIQL